MIQKDIVYCEKEELKKESLCVDSPIVVPGTFLMMLFLAVLLEKKGAKKTEKPFNLKGYIRGC